MRREVHLTVEEPAGGNDAGRCTGNSRCCHSRKWQHVSEVVDDFRCRSELFRWCCSKNKLMSVLAFG